MRFLFVMDPPEKVDPDGDTTLVLMEEAARRGHEVLHAEVADLSIDADGPRARTRPVSLAIAKRPPFSLGAPSSQRLSECDVVLMRRDPPYDLEYYFATLLLEQARSETFIVNDPRGLRDANEKLYALKFAAFTPPTIITREAERLRQFQAEHGGEIIVKPLDGCGGMGVFHIRSGDRNRNAILETVTDYGRKWAVGQRYLPEARAGDKRVVLLDGRPIGAVLRVPREDETRSNLHVGGQAQKTELDARERALCEALGPVLRQDGLWLVGIDIIGGYLTEVNVTSPTGVRQINRLEGVALEGEIIDWIEGRARRT